MYQIIVKLLYYMKVRWLELFMFFSMSPKRFESITSPSFWNFLKDMVLDGQSSAYKYLLKVLRFWSILCSNQLLIKTFLDAYIKEGMKNVLVAFSGL